jgi:hypothetical protein
MNPLLGSVGAWVEHTPDYFDPTLTLREIQFSLFFVGRAIRVSILSPDIGELEA